MDYLELFAVGVVDAERAAEMKAFEEANAAMVAKAKADLATPGYGTGDVAAIIKTAMYLAQNKES